MFFEEGYFGPQFFSVLMEDETRVVNYSINNKTSMIQEVKVKTSSNAQQQNILQKKKQTNKNSSTKRISENQEEVRQMEPNSGSFPSTPFL